MRASCVMWYGVDAGMGGQTHIRTTGFARIGHARGDTAYDQRCAAHTILDMWAAPRACFLGSSWRRFTSIRTILIGSLRICLTSSFRGSSCTAKYFCVASKCMRSWTLHLTMTRSLWIIKFKSLKLAFSHRCNTHGTSCDFKSGVSVCCHPLLSRQIR
jgi:hypothetical protein